MPKQKCRNHPKIWPNAFFECSSDLKVEHKARDAKALQATLAATICPRPMLNITSVHDLPGSIGKGRFSRELTLIGLDASQQKGADISWLKAVDKQMRDPYGFKLLSSGSSGSYLIVDEKKNSLAIVKPEAEAGKNSQALGTPGAAFEHRALRARGAYLVGKGLTSVPEVHAVTIVRDGQVQTASVAKFVENDGSLGTRIIPLATDLLRRAGINIGEGLPSLSSYRDTLQQLSAEDRTKLGTYGTNPENALTILRQNHKFQNDIGSRVNGREVRGIGILDLLIQNADPNLANVMLKEEGDFLRLIPIDHDVAFPTGLYQRTDTDLRPEFWMVQEAGRQPFDQETIAWVEQLDIEGVAKQLHDIGLDDDRILGFRQMAILVKSGVAAGLTLYDIGACTISPSPIKEVVKQARTTVANQGDGEDVTFLEAYTDGINRLVSAKADERARQGMTDYLKLRYPTLSGEALESVQTMVDATKAVWSGVLEYCSPQEKAFAEAYERSGSCALPKLTGYTSPQR